ncbi:septum site-determining protein Ssd [Corynebacterium epidermidicanis]|uniref:Helicase/secretion neighborhood CpaE-like protein n=1 Tax=Corynebacterium epidermidicanis TaxID=1050174 RepID=A0A0G3GLU9_9CORY|nr:septum site-determining protein Ssd [Corynebacterium epidermidicanis]AKK02171.1 helicase/secretion neighborhood CpaE-like protein [Corynebacterium epidermidicanis]
MNAILVAIADPTLHPEVMHIAAATGHKIVDTVEPVEIARLARSASAVVVDKDAALTLKDLPPRPGIYFVAADPGPIDWRSALRCGAEDGYVIPAQSPELLRALGSSQEPEPPALGRRNCLGVMPAVGGAGASTLAAAVALASGSGVLIDADPYSGGVDLLLGIESELGARWGDISFDSGQVSSHDLRQALPKAQQVSVLTSHRGASVGPTFSPADVVRAVDSLRTEDVIIDLPRWGDQMIEIAAGCAALVVVIPAEIRALSAAADIAARSRRQLSATEMVAVLRHRGWCGVDLAEAERLAGMPIIAELPHVSTLSKSVETQGLVKLPRALKKCAEEILAERRVWAC